MMLKPFILSFNSTHVTRRDLLNFLDTQEIIKNWYAYVPEGILLVSKKNTKDIADVIRKQFPQSLDFIVSEITSATSDGWIDRKVWDRIFMPKSSGRWPD